MENSQYNIYLERGQLALLDPLSLEDWLGGATVTGAGKPLKKTVQYYAQWLAKHDRSHLKQFI